MKKLFSIIVLLSVMASFAVAEDEHPTHYSRVVLSTTEGGTVYLAAPNYLANGVLAYPLLPEDMSALWNTTQSYDRNCQIETVPGRIETIDNLAVWFFVNPAPGYRFLCLQDADGNDLDITPSQTYRISMDATTTRTADTTYYVYNWSEADIITTLNPATDPANPALLRLMARFARINESGDPITFRVRHAAAEGGSYTVSSSSFNGSVTAEATLTTHSSVEPVTLSATPASGYEFVGWYRRSATYSSGVDESFVENDDDEFFSFRSSVTIYCDQDEAIYPRFAAVDGSGTALFAVGNQVFEDLLAAVDYSDEIAEENIILIASGLLYDDYGEIPAGKTLIIPYDDRHIGYKTAVEYGPTSLYGSPYKTLILGEDAYLEVAGSICVSARQSAVQGAGSTSTVYGDYGFIRLEEGSEIALKSGAELFVYGYISGDGQVTVENGATVYENFQILDWRGGTYLLQSVMTQLQSYAANLLQFTQAVAALQSGAISSFDEVLAALVYPTKGYEMMTYQGTEYLVPKPYAADMIFPLTQYCVQNVESRMVFYAGGVEKLSATIAASGQNIHFDPFTFIGTDDGLFRLSEGAQLIKWYDCTDYRQRYQIEGNASIEKIYLGSDFITWAFQNFGAPFTGIQSELYILPIAHNMDLEIVSGSNVRTEYGICLLPGANITIDEGAVLTVGPNASVYVYDEDDWNGHNFAGTGDHRPVEYIVCDPDYDYEAQLTLSTGDASININGTMVVSQDTVSWSTIVENTDPAIIAMIYQGLGVDETTMDMLYDQVTGGAVYTTVSGANIYSSEETGSFVQQTACGEATSVSHSEAVTGPNTEIAVVPARFHNADGSYASADCDSVRQALVYDEDTHAWVSADPDSVEVGPVLPTSCEKTLAASAFSVIAADGYLTITVTEPQTICIFSASGMLLHSSMVSDIKLISLPQGIYLVQGSDAVKSAALY